MKKSIYLSIYISIYLSISLNGQVINSQEIDKGTSIERNTIFNLEELKVRWKKAALENCPGVPCVVTPASACGSISTVSDIDGNVYNTVSIGTQCWTKENLKVTKYNDGTVIPLNNTHTSGTVSTVWQGLITGAYAIYDNQASSGTNATNYGFLYNWYAVTDTKSICPAGWGIPTDAEWTTLTTFIGTNPGDKLKKNDALWTTNTGTDDYGFSVLPGGYRFSDGSFNGVRGSAFFWSATENYNDGGAWGRGLYASRGDVGRGFLIYYGNKSVGASVRCLRD